tara:strand:- start:790 stop:1002 length:213 start_codon:yes stop_codon:yes gene_type:complete
MVLCLSFLLMGCSDNEITPALFDTKQEAENAAEKYNCKGAHQMDKKWMPCEIHAEHQENKGGAHIRHHNH